MSENRGVEIARHGGGLVLRDCATGEVYPNILRVELVASARHDSQGESWPVLRVTVLNISTSPDRQMAIPAGPQYLTVSSPVFVEVKQERYHPDPKQAARKDKRARRLSRARQILNEEKQLAPLRRSDYAQMYATLVEFSEAHPEVKPVVGMLPVPLATV